MTVLFVLLLLVIAAGAVWFVWRALRYPRQILSLALGLCITAILGVALVVVVGISSPLVGGRDQAYGTPTIQVGAHMLLVSSPINSWVGSTGDPATTAWVRETYGRSAIADPGRRVGITVHNPTTSERVLSDLALLAWAGVLIGWLGTLARMLARAVDGQPFADANLRGLRIMAGLTALGAIAVLVVNHLVANHLIRATGGSGSVGWDFGFTWLIFAFVLLALAEIWRQGIELRRDVEATV